MKLYCVLVLGHDKVLFDGSIELAAKDGRIAGRMVYAQRGSFKFDACLEEAGLV